MIESLVGSSSLAGSLPKSCGAYPYVGELTADQLLLVHPSVLFSPAFPPPIHLSVQPSPPTGSPYPLLLHMARPSGAGAARAQSFFAVSSWCRGRAPRGEHMLGAQRSLPLTSPPRQSQLTTARHGEDATYLPVPRSPPLNPRLTELERLQRCVSGLLPPRRAFLSLHPQQRESRIIRKIRLQMAPSRPTWTPRSGKTQDLEEEQPTVEQELRSLMEKPERLRTTRDRRREEQLMAKLVEIVNDRNAIIDGLDEDRLREDEEDEELDKMMMNFNIKKDKPKKKSPMSKLFTWGNKKED
ncbi:MICAL-like protein 2 [Liparis tanakae]|uniref:MICAL-like protein 2 n=1 Tax=Liparis tanakae TaxID=230148 RepID=A0A4Z2F3A0_9TELE|nr:MICAL-like protein 2 [Liparis tanakae]